MKKIELTSESKVNAFGKTLFRIKALISFSSIKEGETGGWVCPSHNIREEVLEVVVLNDVHAYPAHSSTACKAEALTLSYET